MRTIVSAHSRSVDLPNKTPGVRTPETKVSGTISVPIAALLPGDSPRTHGLDQEHATQLAEHEGPLPPILVNRRDLRVIDGMHRLLAAYIKGQETVDVEFFDGSPEDAFLRAVEANVKHGLPLSLADRRAAAARIIDSHPQMSDRAIARASGLGSKAVAAIRRRSTDAIAQLNTRVGRDGRVRPLNGAEGRRKAAEVIAQNPGASLREIARLAGISPATASDVRRRLKSGEPPAPTRTEAGTASQDPVHVSSAQAAAPADKPVLPSPRKVPTQGHRAVPATNTPGPLLDKLARDPSLRLKEDGRQLLRLLQQNAVTQWPSLTAAVPSHCGELIGSLARQFAANWLELAQQLEEREQSGPSKACN
ncbi:ParB and winged helix-turn-helix domain-containing protein [Streptomyces sp. NRRL S-37]|uniref:ParB and winged helix-turn-helix domain-containing protein n=1 Tax=Streptomyces sp. NRRL S-37 TaxID=1463903 RepID=UPI000D1473F4|nr:ParB N-terminal domain-containing protein [Streptomyces sp. NRRL S-37]